jgi:hypothetical protein
MDANFLKERIVEAKENAHRFSQVADKAGPDERGKWSDKSRDWAQYAAQLEALLKGSK